MIGKQILDYKFLVELGRGGIPTDRNAGLKWSTNTRIGKAVSHYRILEKLQKAETGVVYGAKDAKLKRSLTFTHMERRCKMVDRSRWLG